MGKDIKKRLQNKKLKRLGIGMKWQRHFSSQEAWQKAVSLVK